MSSDLTSDIGINYCGYWGATSGMGEACRNFIKSLDVVGARLTTELAPNIRLPVNLGHKYDTAVSHHGKDINYQAKIIHVTPTDVWQIMTPYVYTIFRLAWETDRLPKDWTWMLNHSVDEVWTGDEYHAKAFKKSGLKVPIWVCPEPVDTDNKEVAKFNIAAGNIRAFDGYLFYTIGEFIERKDFKTLLQSYWKEFQGEDKVGLLIKTYREKESEARSLQIISDMSNWKRELKQHHYPKAFLSVKIMNSDEITRLHETGDCYVSSHRGEGWGIPIAEAMVRGNPVISTDLGGIHEHLPDNAFFPVKYQMRNVFGMEWAQWYKKDMMWAQADSGSLREKMRHVFNNKDKAKEVGKIGQTWVKENLNHKLIGEKMMVRLSEVLEK